MIDRTSDSEGTRLDAVTVPFNRASVRLAWLPIGLVLVAFPLLLRFDNVGRYDPRFLLPALNIIFLIGASWLVAYLAARDYAEGHSVSLLLLGGGMLSFGGGSALAAAAALLGLGANVVTTSHNVGAYLASVCCLASTTLILAGHPPSRTDHRGLWIGLIYGSLLALTLLLAAGALTGWLPAFFVPGVGATRLRDLVLATAVTMFVAAGVHLMIGGRRMDVPFVRWCALAFLLFAVGLLAVLLERELGSPLSWLGRGSQYLGCLYLFVGILSSRVGAQAWNGVGLHHLLRETSDRYRRLVEHSPDGILVHDGERFLFANPTAALILGAESSADIVGHRVLDFTHPDWRERVAGRIASARRGLVTPIVELQMLRVDGSPVDVDITGTQVEYEGRPAVQIVVRDITVRKRAEEALENSERLYRAIGESIDYGVWVCAPDGRNIYASESFLRLVGMTQEQCSDFGWGALLHPDDLEHTMAAWRECVRTEGSWDIEHRFKSVDGTWRPVLARGVPVRDEQGKILCWAGINLDIGRLKAAEEELRAADRRKNEFLATLSHELRNPLAPIRYALALLEQPGVDTAMPLGVIERQLAHMVRLVDDLLDLTRISSNKVLLRRQRIDVASIVHHAVEAVSPEVSAAHHTLDVVLPPDPVWLDADSDRMAQVLTNLLNNAARYTPPGGHLTLSVTVTEDHRARISVSDDGVGIQAKDLPRVFEIFTQVGPPGRGGLGIGLAIVRGLVELHGGTIEALSAGPERGSEFVVSLPCIAPPPSMRTTSSGLVPSTIRRRVLVVDDNIDSADMMKMLLEMLGHSVRVAYTGASALAVFESFEPEVGLFDIGLPDISGNDLAMQVRCLPRGATIRLIAVTGWGQEEDRERARAHGFDAHLTKPADPEALQRLVVGAPPAPLTGIGGDVVS